jgi:hypothetical protein
MAFSGMLAMAAGSVWIRTSGETTTLGYSSGLLIWLGCLCALGVGIGALIATVFEERAIGLKVVAVAGGFGLLVVPAMGFDRVVITPTDVSQTTGFWFAPTVERIRYDTVESISIKPEFARRATHRVWHLHLRDGTDATLQPSDLLEGNESLIVRKLRGYGVQFR